MNYTGLINLVHFFALKNNFCAHKHFEELHVRNVHVAKIYQRR